MFMANAISYLGQSSAGHTGQSAAAGERIDLVAPLSAMKVEVTDPAGEVSEIALGTRDYTLGQTTRVGIYQLAYYDSAGALLEMADLPVSLINDEESNIAPAETIRVQGTAEALASADIEQEIVGRREVRTNREFFTWLIVVVLLIMGVEWYLYHTRAL